MGIINDWKLAKKNSMTKINFFKLTWRCYKWVAVDAVEAFIGFIVTCFIITYALKLDLLMIMKLEFLLTIVCIVFNWEKSKRLKRFKHTALLNLVNLTPNICHFLISPACLFLIHDEFLKLEQGYQLWGLTAYIIVIIQVFDLCILFVKYDKR